MGCIKGKDRPVNWAYPRFNVHIAKKVLAGSFTPGYVQHRPVHRGASSRDVARVGRDAAPASVVQHKPRPRAALGEPPRGTRDRGPVRLAVNAKAERCRVARREDADARVMCVRVPAFRARPSDRAGLAKSRPCAFSARHSPHWGDGKETGHPAPEAKSGDAIAWLFDS